ncbi:ATP-binding protein [Magnetococcales bacterium HHB-1]
MCYIFIPYMATRGMLVFYRQPFPRWLTTLLWIGLLLAIASVWSPWPIPWAGGSGRVLEMFFYAYCGVRWIKINTENDFFKNSIAISLILIIIIIIVEIFNAQNTIMPSQSIINLVIWIHLQILIMMSGLMIYWRSIRRQLFQEQERLREARYKAEESNRAKDRFLAVVSHELRTPLTSLLGTAEILGNKPLSYSVKYYIHRMQLVGMNLLNLVNDILDHSKMNSGQIQLKKIPFQPDIEINQVIQLIKPLAEKKGLKFQTEIVPFPSSVVGDPLRVRQILTNLLSNAVKFTQQGKVCLKIKYTRMEAQRITLHVEVTDTGIGISKENQSKIFSSFVQVDDAMSRHHEGSGLGLTIVRQLVEQMKGDVVLHSQKHQGSTFSIKLPLVEVSPSHIDTDVEQERLNRSLSSLTILLAEDNEISRMVVKEQLQQYGHKVTAVSSGQHVIKLLHIQKNYDVILMDIQMPGLSGLETTQHIRAMDDEMVASLPIVALTANLMSQDHQRYMQAGMDDVLEKPLNIQRFNHVIGRMLGEFSSQTTSIHHQSTDFAPWLKNTHNDHENIWLEQILLLETDTLQNIRSQLSQEQYQQTLDRFTDQGQIMIQKMQQGCRLSDTALVARMAHSLASSCCQLGLLRLCGLVKEIETLALQCDSQPWVRLVDQLDSLWQHSINRLQSEK